jgi:hypothetical protein
MTDYSKYDGLLSYDYAFETGTGNHLRSHTLECWLEYYEADSSVGEVEDWAVFYAYLDGVDIVELLSEEVKEQIILGAMQYCADEAAQAYYP